MPLHVDGVDHLDPTRDYSEGSKPFERRDCTGPRPARRTHVLPVESAERKNYPLYSGFFAYFPAAIAAIAKLSKEGNDKHNPGQPLHHSRDISNDHLDCELRHMLDAQGDFGAGQGRDEKGVPQCVMKAWRALAECQIWLEQNDGAPIAPAAHFSKK